MIQKVKEFFSKKESVQYYADEIMPRALREKRSVGGMRITMRFVKTIKQFGKTKVETQVETFDNYHCHRGTFRYNPPCDGNYDGWEYLYFEDCEKYPFAPVTTEFLQTVIDDWFDKRTPEWYEQNNLEPLSRNDGWKR